MYGKFTIMKKENRVIKGYKIKDSVYKKAIKRADKEKYPLATQIEDWVTTYSKGLNIGIFDLITFPSNGVTPLTKSTKAAKK